MAAPKYIRIYVIWVVAESFFQLLKRERIRRRIYDTREQAKRDIFDYIEVFYNRKRKHGFNQQQAPIEFEKQFYHRQFPV